MADTAMQRYDHIKKLLSLSLIIYSTNSGKGKVANMSESEFWSERLKHVCFYETLLNLHNHRTVVTMHSTL